MSDILLVLAGIAVKVLFDAVTKDGGLTFTVSIGRRDKR